MNVSFVTVIYVFGWNHGDEKKTTWNIFTLLDTFIYAVWFHSFGRFFLRCVVSLFWTLLSPLCDFTLLDAFVSSVWFHSFGRFHLGCVVSLFWTLLSPLCGFTLLDAFIYAVWFHSFGSFCLRCVVALFWTLLSPLCGFTLLDAFVSVWFYSFRRFSVRCVVSLFWTLLSTLCSFTVLDAFVYAVWFHCFCHRQPDIRGNQCRPIWTIPIRSKYRKKSAYFAWSAVCSVGVLSLAVFSITKMKLQSTVSNANTLGTQNNNINLTTCFLVACLHYPVSMSNNIAPTVGWLMNDELEGIGKEPTVALMR
jgi:hypothetical protein